MNILAFKEAFIVRKGEVGEVDEKQMTSPNIIVLLYVLHLTRKNSS